MEKTAIKVPLLDLQAQYEPIKRDVMQAIASVFDRKQFILGNEVRELEGEIATYCQSKEAVGVSSGTDALLIALMALDIGPGDEVITSPFTFFATAGSIARVGAKPVFVDIDPKTYNIDAKQIEAVITNKTKCIMPVHVFGQMADMDAIMDIAKRHGLWVIEDAAQAIGSEYKGRRAGSIGDIGCFSFFPSKNLGAIGDGGIATTNKQELAEKMRVLRMHGSKPKYVHHLVGGNFRLDTIQAAVLLVKLKELEKQHAARQENAAFYDEALKGIVDIPVIDPKCRMIYNQYTIRTPKRESLQNKLTEANIGNAIYYPIPLHRQACFENLGYAEGSLPEAESAADEVLSIPVYAELSKEQKNQVVTVIRDALQ